MTILRTQEGLYYDDSVVNADGTHPEVFNPPVSISTSDETIKHRIRCMELASKLPDAHTTAEVIKNGKAIFEAAGA